MFVSYYFHKFWSYISQTKKMSQFQKQPPELSYRKSCFQKFRNIHRETPVLESPFNRFAGFKTCNFPKKGLRHRRFPVNIAKFLRTLIWWKSADNCYCSSCFLLLIFLPGCLFLLLINRPSSSKVFFNV